MKVETLLDNVQVRPYFLDKTFLTHRQGNVKSLMKTSRLHIIYFNHHNTCLIITHNI